ncbi:acid protease [Wolfiporia cocos MD-104 SS10]|uniref:Acid protease n=1 Tax=Wolfiporia cocos (strain MD-104) TaxID=742152 RepID=A0A2H3JP38_WOLCO|nr:acid protease [Wolfiporia cocos MD-104 SS10]
MFCKASLLTVALALIASATPVTRDTGIRIPVHKRSVKNADGTVNRDAVIRDKVRMHNKHVRNLKTIDSKIGLENYHVGAHIPKLAVLPEHLRKRQSESLTDQDEEEWTGTVDIGTPSQSFVIDFDTGSSDLWVASSSCSSCEASATYDPSASSTSEEQSGTFEIEYGDGSTASGPIYTDDVSVAGISVTGQYLSAVDSESGDLVGDVADGLMGMGWPALSQLDADPFFWTAIDQGAVSQGVFGFYLADSGSELYLGGTDSYYYTGDIEYYDLVSSAGYWQIGGASAIVNGETVVSDIETIIDSGTTLMYGPPSAVEDFYSNIDGAQSIGDGAYGIPCDSFPTIAFTWGGNTFTISSDAFNLGSVGDGLCQAALGGDDLGFGDNVWLLGDTLLQSVYTAFSVDDSAVGFANLS